MNLIDLKVLNENVGVVIKEVMKFCGKILNVVFFVVIVKRVVDLKLFVFYK